MVPFWDPYYNTAPNSSGTQKGTIILTNTHMVCNLLLGNWSPRRPSPLHQACSFGRGAPSGKTEADKRSCPTPRVQVPNNHILSKILTYITTILKPSTSLLGPLDPWGYEEVIEVLTAPFRADIGQISQLMRCRAFGLRLRVDSRNCEY